MGKVEDVPRGDRELRLQTDDVALQPKAHLEDHRGFEDCLEFVAVRQAIDRKQEGHRIGRQLYQLYQLYQVGPLGARSLGEGWFRFGIESDGIGAGKGGKCRGRRFGRGDQHYAGRSRPW